MLGDAYEYLIGQFASGAGKKAGEFYTPQQVSKISGQELSRWTNLALRVPMTPPVVRVHLLLRIGKEAEVSEFFGQELNRTTYNLCRMNMILHDVHFRQFDIRQEDTLDTSAASGFDRFRSRGGQSTLSQPGGKARTTHSMKPMTGSVSTAG